MDIIFLYCQINRDKIVVIFYNVCNNRLDNKSIKMKITRTKTPKGINLYIVKSYRVKGKSTSKVVLKLGKLEELNEKYGDGLKYAYDVKKSLEEEEAIIKKEKALDIRVYKDKDTPIIPKQKIGGHLFLRPIFRKLGIYDFLKEVRENSKITYPLEEVLEYLVFARVLAPKSKLATHELCKHFVDEPKFDLQHTYRTMDVINKYSDKIQQIAYKVSSKLVKDDHSILFYDMTNFFFESEEADGLRQYGVSKEHRPNPIVQFGLFTNGKGIPLGYGIYPGNTNEQVTLKPLEKRILKDYGLAKVIVCTDAGLASSSNRAFNDIGERGFVVTQSIKKLPAHLKEWVFNEGPYQNKKDWKRFDESNKYIETTPSLIEDEEDINSLIYKSRYMVNDITVLDDDGNKIKIQKGWRLIVSYSKKYALYQKSIREKQVSRAKAIIASPGKYNKGSANDVKRFIKNIAFDKDGQICKSNLIFDENLVNEEAKYDGYYAVTTNLIDNEQDIIAINHNRWKIEDCFRLMKTDFKSRPVYHYKDKRIESHFLICFLALLIFRLLHVKLRDKYTSNELLTTLREMEYYKYEEGYLTPFATTPLVSDLNEMFDMKASRQGYSESTMKFLIKSSKCY